MKILFKIIFILFVVFSFSVDNASAINPDKANLKLGIDNGKNTIIDNNSYLNSLENSDTDYTVSQGGEKGIYNSIIRIARDLKNLLFFISGIYLLILVIKLLFSEKTEEEATNFKKGIVWTSIGIIVIQISYYFINILFDKDINIELSTQFIDVIIAPFITLLETAASFFFIAMMFYAFYILVTSNGDEEQAKKGKMSVLYAAIGFIVIKISKNLITAIYGKANCSNTFQTNCINQTNLDGAAGIIVQIINWMNGFVGILVILLIIYAGFLTLTSFGDEEKLKKSKNIIIYITIGLFILITNYLILTFFLLPETTI